MLIRILLILLLLPLISCAGPSIGYVGPSISSTSGTWTHGSSITISGSSFGTKSPAEPLIWDDCEGATTDSDAAVVGSGSSAERNDAGTGWDEVWPLIVGANTTSHRTRYRDAPHEGTPAPHQHSDTYLVGGHYQYENNNPGYITCNSGELYRNVCVTIDNGSAADHWYAHFYYRLNADWNTADIGGKNNHKITVVQSGGESYTPGRGFQYTVYEANHSPALESGDTCTIETSSGNLNNPRLDWIKWEELIDNGGERQVIVDNEDDAQYLGTNIKGGLRSFTFGGYYRFVASGGSISDVCDYRGSVYSINKNFRYFDDLYADTTWSRVMLCTSSSYPTTDSYVCEPQIPSAWSASSITVTVNLGQITGSKAYLYVFDSNNDANATGYEISLRGKDRQN